MAEEEIIFRGSKTFEKMLKKMKVLERYEEDEEDEED